MLVRIAVAVDPPKLAETLIDLLSTDSSQAFPTSRRDPLTVFSNQPYDIIILSEARLLNPRPFSPEHLDALPVRPAVILLTESDDTTYHAQMMAKGYERVLSQTMRPKLIARVVRSLADKVERAGDVSSTTSLIQMDKPRLSDFVSKSRSMQELIRISRRVVSSDSSILITGETGVGKERLALAIHEEGNRARGPFVAINCAAMPEQLLESELFGHERGAFTGALRARRGRFELAHGGTIFLDEIADMPIGLQAKLLRVLQDRSFYRVGGEKPITVDVRIMAATNKNIGEAIQQGRFRADLYYRLGVITLQIAPLRERREDIAEIAKSYVDYLAPRIGVNVDGISRDALNALVRYSWPGNIRELGNVIERAMLLTDTNEITPDDLPDDVAYRASERSPSDCESRDLSEAHMLAHTWKEYRRIVLDRIEKDYIRAVLQQSRGAVKEAAALSGFSPRAMHQKLLYHGLRRKAFG